ncbi:electron transfer flavoprotein subunit beta/FixA family protein [Ancylobacter mangrovi]|uniref:electron transfer flavoprotein subunit beta/FixA family protein n=1 Tax=Ancylobacter mangrovi TaxID=2972472 RepID=UPI0021632AED|nr:electron transfer flavoprotein subunit beta/FixA family protein [Ancylobacter mangrovi]MCS0503347.1 electron transfer flavoprotein subunit beta/FixA family protein [Ancylobacter mangrovi]
MKAIVAVKRVVDPNMKIRLKADGSGIELTGTKMAMNPFDEIALEEAIRQKEAGKVSEIVAVTIGSASASETLRHALAMGADRAIHLVAETSPEPLAVARLLAEVIRREEGRLALLGKQAIDDDTNATGQMLAATLGWPQATFASRLAIEGDIARVTREIDGGLESWELPLPLVVTADLRLNEPRYASLPNIMKAKKKPLESIDAASLGVDLTPRLERLSLAEPAGRKAGVKVGSVDELAAHIRTLARA